MDLENGRVDLENGRVDLENGRVDLEGRQLGSGGSSGTGPWKVNRYWVLEGKQYSTREGKRVLGPGG